MSKRTKGITLTGGSSLLVIFAVLCLTVFALLTISTVKADSRLADATVTSIEAFYKADCAAEEILAQLRSSVVPQEVEQSGNTFFYACPLSETQELCVCVVVEGEKYEILQWTVVPTAEWSPDEYITVWNPELEE